MFSRHPQPFGNRGDIGDDVELQTDVMRFMAILAFCLVAIFAIVQSMPLAPAATSLRPDSIAPPPAPELRDRPLPSPSAPGVARSVAAVVPVSPAPARSTAVPQSAALLPLVMPHASPVPGIVSREALPRPAYVPATRSGNPDRPLTKPKLVAAAPRPAPEPASAPVTETTSGHRGIALRFESDAALRHLVAAREIRVYAIEGRTFSEMTVHNDAMRFETNGAPARYHEMVADTVPAEVRSAFAGSADAWGVTLPDGTTQQLLRLARTGFDGTVVITFAGSLRLEGTHQ